MKKYLYMCLLAVCFLMLAGCGKAAPEDDTISVDKKGKILYTIVEDFDKDFYDAAELQTMIEEEAEAYNGKFGQPHLFVEKFEVKDGVAVLQLQFDEGKYYADYSGMTLFSGSVVDALDEGYNLFGECMGTDGALTDLEHVEGAEAMEVLILEEAVSVEVPGTIVCVSRAGNVMINGKKEATVLEAEEAFIIYK